MVESPAEDVNRRTRTSRFWKIFGRRLPRSEIVFFYQMILIYVVVGVSLFNLTSGHGPDKLWVALFGAVSGIFSQILASIHDQLPVIDLH